MKRWEYEIFLRKIKQNQENLIIIKRNQYLTNQKQNYVKYAKGEYVYE